MFCRRPLDVGLSHLVAHIPVVLEQIHSHQSTELQSLPHYISAVQEARKHCPVINPYVDLIRVEIRPLCKHF